MSQFEYVLPSGAKFSMQAPAGTTQTQADLIFYGQVAAGALVNFTPGQSVSGSTSALTKFALSRLDRGTAGVDDAVILAIVNGQATAASVPNLIDTPLTRPVAQSDIVSISSTGFTAPTIGGLTSEQTQALMAQVANIVNQPATTANNNTGVGRYGLDCQMLEMAGYVKPGTWQQFLQSGTNTLIGILGSPGVWTGLDGITSLQEFLDSLAAQNNAQATLMVNSYSSLQAAGVITTPAPAPATTVLASIYTDAGEPAVVAARTVTAEANNQVASLVANGSQYGTRRTAQWASGTGAGNDAAANDLGLLGIAGATVGLISQIPNLGTLNLSAITDMNVLGKASQYAAGAAQLASEVSSEVSSLQGAVSGAVGRVTGELKAVVSDVTGSINNFFGSDTSSGISGLGNIAGVLGGIDIAGSASSILNELGLPNAGLSGLGGLGLPGGLSVDSALSNLFSGSSGFGDLLSGGGIGGLFSGGGIGGFFGGGGGGGDILVSAVQPIPTYQNTTNRAAVDVATAQIIGSDKIPLPSFGPVVPQSSSVAAALDIAKGKFELSSLRSQGIALVEQATSAVQAVVNPGQFGIQFPGPRNFV
jgi:hypothetical protein